MPDAIETEALLLVGGNHSDRLSEVTRPEIAAARRSWLTDPGRGMDKTGCFVPLSRVNRPDNICSSRLLDPASVAVAALSAVIDSTNLMPASIKPAAADPMPLPPGLSRAALACGRVTPAAPTGLAAGDTATAIGFKGTGASRSIVGVGLPS